MKHHSIHNDYMYDTLGISIQNSRDGIVWWREQLEY